VIARGQAGLPEDNEPREVWLPGQSSPIRGHRLDHPAHSSFPSSRYEVRLIARDRQQQLVSCDFRDLLSSPQPHQRVLPWSVTRQEVSQELQQQRHTSQSVLPKDHSLQVRSVELVVNDSDSSDRYFEQMTEIGQVEGFLMVGLSSQPPTERQDRLDQVEYSNFALYQTEPRYTWLEDSSEILSQGARLVPPRLPGGEAWITQVLHQERRERLGELAQCLEGQEQGKVSLSQASEAGVAQGLVQGQRAIVARSYLEGGNLLSGQRKDGTPYVLVGRDSLALTRHLLASTTGRMPSLEEVQEVVAQDLGLLPEQVFPVEQPGTYHVDLCMTSIGPGRIALQDSRKAAELHLKELERSGYSLPSLKAYRDRLEAWVARRTPLEALAQRDLLQAGLEVARVAGAFPSLSDPNRDSVNFFNARHGTSPDGVRYSILMGAPSQLEQHFAQAILDELQAPIDRLYFLDPAETDKTLQRLGGLKCRTKLQGDELPPHPAPQPFSEPQSQTPSQLPLWKEEISPEGNHR
jgi:hypothetical protein